MSLTELKTIAACMQCLDHNVYKIKHCSARIMCIQCMHVVLWNCNVWTIMLNEVVSVCYFHDHGMQRSYSKFPLMQCALLGLSSQPTLLMKVLSIEWFAW